MSGIGIFRTDTDYIEYCQTITIKPFGYPTIDLPKREKDWLLPHRKNNYKQKIRSRRK